MSQHNPLPVFVLAIVGVIATTGQQSCTGTARTQLPNANLIIRKATYGDLPNGMTLDVTDGVRALVKNGSLAVKASDDNFGDPYHGQMRLTIVRAIFRSVASEVDVTNDVRGNVDGNRLMGPASPCCRLPSQRRC